jgi:hypothetical protein
MMGRSERTKNLRVNGGRVKFVTGHSLKRVDRRC